MSKLTIKQKADLFDALFDQEKIEVVDVEELGNPNYPAYHHSYVDQAFGFRYTNEPTEN